jgi:F-type H+-transporting ATPase subunit epsilon
VKPLDPSTTPPLDHSFQIELLTPEGMLLQDRAEEVVVPGHEGYFGVLRGHEYFATTLKPGVLTVKWQDKNRCYRVSGGVVQVTPEKVIVCAESAVLTEVEHK